MAADLRKKLSRDDYTVGWICALSIELAASSGMLDEVHQDLDLVQGDKNMYILGEIAGHNIVMACLPAGNMGVTPASNVAANMLRSFPKIRFGLMVGIGGGAPARRARPNEDIRLGDVVVSTPQGTHGGVVEYDRGKVVAGGAFEHMGLLNMPPTPLTNAVAKLKGIHESKRNGITRNVADMIKKVMQSEDANPDFKEQYTHPNPNSDLLFEADYEHNESQPEDNDSDDSNDLDEPPLPCRACDPTRQVSRKARKSADPVIHYGTIASADQVMRHGVTRDNIRKKYGVLCFEMEAAGLMNDFPCLVIRGICDYSDTHKNKIWQRYAAATAAAYTKELLGIVLKEDVESTEDATKVLERQEQRRKRKEILEWIDPDTHTKRFIDTHEKWHPETAKRPLNSVQYLKWSNEDIQTLWCHGIAGSGKTVFASVVIENLKTARENLPRKDRAGVACLFCEYERQNDQTVRSLASAILRQLAEQCEVLPASVTDLYNQRQRNDKPLHFEEILTALTSVIGKFPQVFLVVDGLDECFESTRKELLTHLSELQKRTAMKILATSRHTFNFRKELGPCEDLEIQANPRDVKTVLDVLIEKSDSLIKSDIELRRTVTEDIVMAVGGMFLLVQPFLESIIGERSKGYIEDALKGLITSPDKISKVYEDALNRIGSQRVGDSKLAHRILSWIVESKRPLTRQEFQHCLAITIGSVKFKDDYIIQDLDGAVALCAGLVVINPKSNTVQLMHHTTRKYFENPHHRPGWMDDGHEMIASACITYVSYEEFGNGPCADDEEFEARLSKYPFLRYASQNWGHHVRDNPTRSMAIDNLAVEFLRNNAKISSSNQARHITYRQYPGYSQDFIGNVDGLQTAAFFGLPNLAERLLIEKDADPTARDGDDKTALHRAAENGHDRVVRILIDHGAEIDTKEGKYGQTPLHLAALNGHEIVTQTLLECRAHSSAKDDDGWMPIHVAAWTGNEEVVRVLIEKNVNETGKDGLTALHCAAAQGHQRVVQVLISNGAIVDVEDLEGWTPLHWASKKRHDIMKPRMLTLNNEPSTLLRQFVAKQEEVMSMLQQYMLTVEEKMTGFQQPLVFWQEKLTWLRPGGVDINVEDEYLHILTTLRRASTFRAAVLPWATASDRDEPPAPVRFIFAIQDELSALNCAIECGHEPVARLLLRHGADINKTCKAKVETQLSLKLDATPAALHLASFTGHEAMVRLLLERGVNVNETSDSRQSKRLLPHSEWTALHFGILSGSDGVVQLLLDNGANVHSTCPVNSKIMNCSLTALQLAVVVGDEKIIHLLISRGADVNAGGTIDLYIRLGSRSDENIDEDARKAFKTAINLTALHLAAVIGKQNILEILMDNNANIETRLEVSINSMTFHLTTLHIAVVGRYREAINLLISRGSSVRTKLRAGDGNDIHVEMSLLHLSTLANDRSLSALLIESGADVNAKCQFNFVARRPSEKKAKPGSEQNKKEMKEKGTALSRILVRAAKTYSVFVSQEFPDTPIGTAMEAYDKLQKEAYLVQVDITPLHIAGLLGHDYLAKDLIEGQTDLNAKFVFKLDDMEIGLTALHLAIMARHERIAHLFLNSGAEIHTKLQLNLSSWLRIETTVLQVAIATGAEDVVQLLLDKGCDINEFSTIGNDANNVLSTLHLATVLGNGDMVRLLMEKGVDTTNHFRIELGNHLGIDMSMLHLAAISGSKDVMQLFLQKRFDIQERGRIHCYSINVDFTATDLAVLGRHAGVMELLLGKNYDIHTRFQVNFGPEIHAELSLLHLAALIGGERILNLLLNAGADIRDKARIYGNLVRTELTVLQIATFAGQEKAIKQFLHSDIESHAPIQVEVGDIHIEFTLLHLAVLWRHFSTALLLLTKGFNANSSVQIAGPEENIKLSALNLATALDQKQLTQLLLHHGADPDATCQIMASNARVDLSSLHFATCWGDKEIVHLLLSTTPPEEHLGPEPDRDTYSDTLSSSYFSWASSYIDSDSNANSQSRSLPENSVRHSTDHSNESYQEEDSSTESSIESSMEGAAETNSERADTNSLNNSMDQSGVFLSERTTVADANAMLRLHVGTTRIEITAMHIAALLKSRQLVLAFLENGANANVNFTFDYENKQIELTALHLAVLWEDNSTVKSLVESGADIEANLRVGINGAYAELSTLHLAAIRGSTDTTELLLDNRARARKQCPVGVNRRVQAELTLLQLLALSEDNDIGKLIHEGVDLHAKCSADVEFWSHSETTALEIASLLKRKVIVDLLAQSEDITGLDDPVNGASLIALLLSSALGHKGLEALLLSTVDDIDGECSMKMEAKIDTAFKIPMRSDIDATFNVHMDAQLSSLHMAAGLGNVEIVQNLLKKGASHERKCRIKAGETMHAELSPLHLAVMWKHEGVVQLLLEKGADAHAIGQVNIDRTAQADLIVPHLAILFGYDKVSRLIQKVVDLELKIQAHLMPLHFAALLDDNVVATSLLKHGANLEDTCLVHIEGTTKSNFDAKIDARLNALHIAAWAGHERLTRSLLMKGVNANLTAQAEGNVEVGLGARFHRQIRAGGTALHFAASTGHEEVFQLLLNFGANIDAKSQDGRTPLQWAKDLGHDKIVQLIGKNQSRRSAARGHGEKTRFRQKWHDVVARDGSGDTSFDGKEESGLAPRDDRPPPSGQSTYHKEGVGNYLKRIALQKGESKLRKLWSKKFSKKSTKDEE